METKVAKVLKHLQEKGNITSWEAIILYNATRLSDIVFRLKKRGYNIKSVWQRETNENGKTSRFTRYFLEEEKDADNK